MNLRIKKKHERAKLELEISSKLSQLTQLNLEIEAVNQQIEMAKRVLKGKKATLEQLRQVNLAFNPIERIQQNQRAYIEKPQYDEHSQKEEVGALIAKYHDYVDRGIIKPRNFVDNYDQASWMSSILPEPEMKKVLEQADRWMEMSAEKRALRLANEPTIDF